MNMKVLCRALRANFLPASILPFLIGAVYAFKVGYPFMPDRFFLGLAGIISAHLSANLFNDYYDHKSGVDAINSRPSPFFGGSRVIQEKLVTPKDVFNLAVLFGLAALASAIILFVLTKSIIVVLIVVLSGFLAFEYTAPPLKLSYNLMGELDIFLLFGVILVMGSFYLFSGEITSAAFSISLPIAFLIAGVIVCNEIPDFDSDIKMKKTNLVAISGKEKGYMLYGAFMMFSIAAIVYNIVIGIFPVTMVFAIMFYGLAIKAFLILKKEFNNTQSLIIASRLTVSLHFFVGVSTILMVIKR